MLRGKKIRKDKYQKKKKRKDKYKFDLSCVKICRNISFSFRKQGNKVKILAQLDKMTSLISCRNKQSIKQSLSKIYI